MENINGVEKVLLALETTDAQASVALYRKGAVYEKLINSDRRHEETVMPAVADFMQVEQAELNELEGLCVDVGPGSFTGVRIGVCHANAMAYALGIPVISVNALEALAYPHLHEGKPVCALIDARNGNGYGALYDEEGKELMPPCPCVTEEFLQAVPEEAIRVGSGYPEGTDFVPAIPRAANVAAIGALRLAETPVGTEARPLYLRPSQAERNRKKA